MKSKATTCLLGLAAVLSACCTAHRETNPNRLYFFENEDRAIIVPVTINDSIPADALFDTGASSTWVQLDSTFCATHPSAAWSNPDLNVTGHRVGWSPEDDEKANKAIYDNPLTVNMCGVDMEFDAMYTVDNSGLIGKFDATLSFSAKDTTRVWELNFKHNYMEAHPAADFTMPADCHVLPLVEAGDEDMCVRFPIKVTCADGATVTIDQTYLIDTGALSDIILLESAEEYDFFRERDDAMLLNHWNNRRYEVDAEVFDGVRLDAARVYLNEGSFMMQDGDYKGIIGLNFMRRFNMFFDLGARKVGFQPIDGFVRTVNPDLTRIYAKYETTEEGLLRVTEIVDVPENPYREAGMMVGDILTATNGVEWRDIGMDDWMKINRSNVRKLSVTRDGVPITLTARFDELGE
jgi:hypothetical protein